MRYEALISMLVRAMCVAERKGHIAVSVGSRVRLAQNKLRYLQFGSHVPCYNPKPLPFGHSFQRRVVVKRAIALLAFAFLLLSQQLGLAHAISHLSMRTDAGSVQKKSLPPELQCEQCLHFSALGSGLPGSPPALWLHALTGSSAAPPPTPVFLPTLHRAFDSRAPPASFRYA